MHLDQKPEPSPPSNLPTTTPKPSVGHGTRDTVKAVHQRKSILKRSSRPNTNLKTSSSGTADSEPELPSQQAPKGRYKLVSPPIIGVTISQSEPRGIRGSLSDLERRRSPLGLSAASPCEIEVALSMQGRAAKRSIPRAFLTPAASGGWSAASIVHRSGKEDGGVAGLNRVIELGEDPEESDYVTRVSIFICITSPTLGLNGQRKLFSSCSKEETSEGLEAAMTLVSAVFSHFLDPLYL